MGGRTGRVTQIMGAVIDVRFTDGVPAINNAIRIINNREPLIAEVAQQMGDGIVRCIAMGPTEGLIRGITAEDLGVPISVPVGEGVLGHMYNVLGEPLDGAVLPEDMERDRKSVV